MIEGIVFDLWNTLAHNVAKPDPMRLLAEALGIDGERRWVRRIERGMMLAPAAGMEGALRQIEAREGLRIEDPDLRRTVVDRWNRAGDDAALFPDVLPALVKLRRRYRLGLLSNTQSFGLQFLDRDGLWDHLDASAFSFEVGALKPRSEMFEAMAARMALAPDKLLMVGDQPRDDILGARDAGMRALRLERPGNPPRRHGEVDEEGNDGVLLTDLAALPEEVARLSAIG